MSPVQSPFAIVPVEVFMDARLTKMQLRVLGAILTFRNRATNLCYPTRQQISERCGYTESNVSRVTSELVALGWLQKVGTGGRSRACRYLFQVPETVPEPETVSESETVPEPDTKTVPEPETGIEQTSKQTNKTICPIALEAWKTGPKNPNDNRARFLKAWNARVREGHDPHDLLAGRQRYAAYCEAEQTNPRFIKHLATLFGPDGWWQQEWKPLGAVPEDRKSILALAAENGIRVTDNTLLTDLRRQIAQQTGMTL